MGTSSTKKLTKYTSGSTIVTADVANSWFGGLYGSYEGSLLDADDPRVIGHVHDGESYDGHAAKIDLVNHVKSKLQHQNLADNAVEKNNVASFLDQLSAIPEYVVDGSDTYYLLNLTSVYDYVDTEIASIIVGASPFETADTNSDSTDDVVRQADTDYSSAGMDFVYGSSKLDDMNDASNGDERFLFDKSKGAFRAGSVNSTQWNDGNRGNYSAAFGRNTTASGISSFAAGAQNTASGDNSFAAGASNTTSGNNSAVFGNSNSVASAGSLVSGELNSILSGSTNLVGGRQHQISSNNSLVTGRENTVEGDYNSVTGYLSDVDDNGNVVGGTQNFARGSHNAIFGENNASENDGGATSNSISSLVSGNSNTTRSRYTVIGGVSNLVNAGADGAVIFGDSNNAGAPNSFVTGRQVFSKVPGEITHGSGRFASTGDAQSTRYVVRGSILNPITAPGIALSVDGLGLNYQMDLNSAYHVNVMLVGKLAGPSTQESGAYKLESLATGPTTAPLAGGISAPIITYIARSSYFLLGGYVNATLTISPGTNRIQVNVSDNHPALNFIPSNWVATVTLTTCRF
jgi:hypothetical protein